MSLESTIWWSSNQQSGQEQQCHGLNINKYGEKIKDISCLFWISYVWAELGFVVRAKRKARMWQVLNQVETSCCVEWNELWQSSEIAGNTREEIYPPGGYQSSARTLTLTLHLTQHVPYLHPYSAYCKKHALWQKSNISNYYLTNFINMCLKDMFFAIHIRALRMRFKRFNSKKIIIKEADRRWHR